MVATDLEVSESYGDQLNYGAKCPHKCPHGRTCTMSCSAVLSRDRVLAVSDQSDRVSKFQLLIQVLTEAKQYKEP